MKFAHEYVTVPGTIQENVNDQSVKNMLRKLENGWVIVSSVAVPWGIHYVIRNTVLKGEEK